MKTSANQLRNYAKPKGGTLARRPPRRVALLISSAFAHGRGILLGIARYSRSVGRWSSFVQARGSATRLPSWFSRWQADGIIARIEHPQVARRLSRCRQPVIDVRGYFDLGVPAIVTDDAAVARLAFDHLIERGFQKLAFAGFRGVDYSERRLAHFRALAEARGLQIDVYQSPTPARFTPATLYEQHFLRFSADMADWVRQLPKPIGVFACNDICAIQVLNTCMESGHAVPEEVSVLGVDDDAVYCDLAVPPLSSIAHNTDRIGYLAAESLDRMMEGASVPPERTLVEPVGVVCRRSTDIIAVEDRDVAAALRFIREHAGDGIRVADVARAAALSRRTLERRFEEVVGRSPHDEIVRVRVQRVQEMLRDTDLPLRAIAHLMGFQHPEYLSTAFRRLTGQRPGEFRAEARPVGS